jgi:hypothetical protein
MGCAVLRCPRLKPYDAVHDRLTAMALAAFLCGNAQVVLREAQRYPLSGNEQVRVALLTCDSKATGFLLEREGTIPKHYHKAHSGHA